MATNPLYYAWVPSTIATACFIIGVGSPDRFIDWPYLWFLFRHINPYFFAVLGVALCVGMSVLGAAWCDARVDGGRRGRRARGGAREGAGCSAAWCCWLVGWAQHSSLFPSSLPPGRPPPPLYAPVRC